MTQPSSSFNTRSCDALVIGGGPAGSTAASLLRDKGWRVTLLEKVHHPRFHIGESLLPMNLPLLERLGVLKDVEAMGVRKHGADFTSSNHGDEYQPIYFEDAIDDSPPFAYQVRRSELDHLLLNNAAAKGVDVHQGVEVKDVVFQGPEITIVTTVDEAGRRRQWQTRFLVDASGRDTFLSRKLGHKLKNPKHQSAAVFAHLQGAARREGRDEGNISIYWFDHGWFWMIPLRDGIVSVGAVCWPEYLKSRRGSLEEFLWQTIELCPAVAERTRGARLVDGVRATGNYSYRSKRMHGPGYVLLGDAFAFVDPVFSSGVYLAMSSAASALDAVDAELRGSRAAPRLFNRFERRVGRGLKTFSWFIYRFTSPAMRDLFMAPRNVLQIQSAVISVLAGDVFRRGPMGFPLACFKLVYLATLGRNASRAWRSFKRRQRNVSVRVSADTAAGDTV